MNQPHFFKRQEDFRKWLIENHDKETELWIGFWKKASGKVGMNYKEALDEALCFGWIDGLVNKYNEESYMQRFTPRRPKSIWSKINTQNIARLTRLGKMMPSGIAQVEAAKKDGRWERAYEGQKNMQMPDRFMEELQKNKKAYKFFKTLNKVNTYAVWYRLQNAKSAETREERTKKFIEMFERGEKFY